MKANIPSHVIGIDVGTTSIKGMLVNNSGEILEFGKQEYSLETGESGICEVDAEIYWRVTCEIIQQLILNSDVDRNRITGIAFSSQGETLIAVDREGMPLCKAIVWLDNRSDQEAEEIKNHFSEQHVMDITGQPEVLPSWPATRVLWLRKNEPRVFEQAAKYLMVEDFLMFRMTGRYCTEYSVSSSTLYLDISKKKWWPEMIEFMNITEEQLPALMPSGEIVGALTPKAAQETGLSEGTFCVTGAYDHAAGAIGSGNIYDGDATLTIGASMAMCNTLDQPLFDRSLNLPCQCHAINGLYFLHAYGPTAGMVLRWFKDEFGQQEIMEAEENNVDVYDLLVQQAEKIPAGSDGLVMLPHLMGTGSPEFNSKARGVFAGITLGMHKGHFIRAIIESVSLMIRHNLEVMRNNGIDVNVIHVLGGASKSNLWNQVLADATGLPVITLQNTENAVMGACLLAAVGTGVFEDLETACRTFVGTDRQFDPHPSNHALYNTLYKKYVSLCRSLEDYWKQ